MAARGCARPVARGNARERPPQTRRTDPLMKSPMLPLLLGSALPALAGLEDARALLKSDPSKAAEMLRAELAKKPEDPWLIYNAGVAAYAAKEFSKADESWQQLAAT